MKLANAVPIGLGSPKNAPHRIDNINTGTNELNDNMNKVSLTFPLMKKAFTTWNCDDRLNLNASQNVTGILPEIAATSGSSR